MAHMDWNRIPEPSHWADMETRMGLRRNPEDGQIDFSQYGNRFSFRVLMPSK
jgi:hypothetical protein